MRWGSSPPGGTGATVVLAVGVRWPGARPPLWPLRCRAAVGVGVGVVGPVLGTAGAVGDGVGTAVGFCDDTSGTAVVLATEAVLGGPWVVAATGGDDGVAVVTRPESNPTTANAGQPGPAGQVRTRWDMSRTPDLLGPSDGGEAENRWYTDHRWPYACFVRERTALAGRPSAPVTARPTPALPVSPAARVFEWRRTAGMAPS